VRNVLVTGGSGFIGSNLAAALLKLGCNVRILRRRNSDLRALGALEVEHALGDVRDKDSLHAAIKGCDTVFHTAATISYWKKERPLMFDVNVRGTRNVVEACLELGVRRLVHTSSTAAIGFPENGDIADETSRFNWEPYDVGYRISKHRAEAEIQRGIKLGLDAVIVNPSVVIGPRDIHFHGGQLIRDIRARKIFYYIEGDMSIAYVDDIVQGHILAALYGRTGERYILCGENLSRRDVIATIAEVVGGIKPIFRLPTASIKIVTSIAETIAGIMNRQPWVTRELLAGSNLSYRLSCRKAQTELGYGFIPFRDAVQKTYGWYRENGLL
jgi:dihydroflavonol-4-reductase